MLRILIVGSGYMGQCHTEACLSLPNQTAKICGIAARNQISGEQLARMAGCAWYPTLEAAIKQEAVDVVDICLPTDLHKDYVIRAAKHGKHVLCEKPLALNLEDLDEMNAACEANGVRLMAGQVVRFMPEFCVLSHFLTERKLGALRMITMKRLVQAGDDPGWRGNPKRSGGGLFDLGIHDIDFLYSVFGMPSSLYAVGWKSSDGCWDHIVINFSWAEGFSAVCESSLRMTGDFPYTVEFCATGDKGTLLYSNTTRNNLRDTTESNSLTLYSSNGPCQPLETESADPFARELQAFITAVQQNIEVPIGMAESREVIRILLLAQHSLESGLPVRLDSINKK